MRIVSGFFRFIIGGFFGFACFWALFPAEAAFATSAPAVIAISVFGLIIVGAVGGIFARDIQRAFGWGFLWLGLCTLALPLSTIVLSGKVAMDAVQTTGDQSSQAASMVGAGIAGTMLTGAAAVIGFFLGAIFLILALVLLLTNRRREVILVDRQSRVAVRGQRIYEDDEDYEPLPAPPSRRPATAARRIRRVEPRVD